MQKVYTILPRKVKSPSSDEVKKLFILDLKYSYRAEKEFLKAMSVLERSSATRYLKACFKGHRIAKEQQIWRIERIFSLLNVKPISTRNAESAQLTLSAKVARTSTLKNTRERELEILAAAEKIILHTIQNCNRLISLANDLGNFEIVLLLEETILEEREAEETFHAVREDVMADEFFGALPEALDPYFDNIQELEAV